VRSSPHLLDWDLKPLPYKIYPGAASIALPRDLNLSGMPTLTALTTSAEAALSAPLDINAPHANPVLLRRALTKRKSVGGEGLPFFALPPSAGALYPIEIYVSAADVEGLESGLYHFSPADLRMTGLRRGDWREYVARAVANRPFRCACERGDCPVGNLLALSVEVSRGGRIDTAIGTRGRCSQICSRRPPPKEFPPR